MTNGFNTVLPYSLTKKHYLKKKKRFKKDCLILQNYVFPPKARLWNFIITHLCVRGNTKLIFNEYICNNWTTVQDFTRSVSPREDRRVRRSWKGVPGWLGTSAVSFTHNPSPHHHRSLGYKQPLWLLSLSLSFQFGQMQIVLCLQGLSVVVFWWQYADM